MSFQNAVSVILVHSKKPGECVGVADTLSTLKEEKNINRFFIVGGKNLFSELCKTKGMYE